MTVAVFCFHFALDNPRVIVRIVLAGLGVILLAKAIADIIKKRKSGREEGHQMSRGPPEG
jgi:hypothetical protein